MRDYIVTHYDWNTERFVPRVVRCETSEQARRATVKDLGWRTEAQRERLVVRPYRPSMWSHVDRIIRLDSEGRYVKHVRNADLERTLVASR